MYVFLSLCHSLFLSLIFSNAMWSLNCDPPDSIILISLCGSLCSYMSVDGWGCLYCIPNGLYDELIVVLMINYRSHSSVEKKLITNIPSMMIRRFWLYLFLGSIAEICVYLLINASAQMFHNLDLYMQIALQSTFTLFRTLALRHFNTLQRFVLYLES